jgi:hypothetical protein
MTLGANDLATPSVVVRDLRVHDGRRDVPMGDDLIIPHGGVTSLGADEPGRTPTLEIAEGFPRRSTSTARIPGAAPQSASRRRHGIGVIMRSWRDPQWWKRTRVDEIIMNPRRMRRTGSEVPAVSDLQNDTAAVRGR